MKNRNGKVIYFQLNILIIVAVFLGITCVSQAQAATYYISPSGTDSNSGTSSGSPWKTFGFAIPRLRGGDTLILRNGTYDSSNSGYLNIDCTAGASNGTAGQPVTIKAEGERQ